ncbi:MAG: serine protease, partial [Ignavibacteria bacterium]|nr:serine protease [Ignavibacteria bacterium]
GTVDHAARTDGAILNAEVRARLQEVVPSVVGVIAVHDYRLETFHYDLTTGGVVKDPLSVTGYKLIEGDSAVTVAENIRESYGGGLIVYRDERQSLILTCEHVLTTQDTMLEYYRDTDGIPTNVLFSRAVRLRSTYQVIDHAYQFRAAEVVVTDTRYDVGLVLAGRSLTVGMTFPFAIGYRTELQWGDVVLAFGYPRKMKQITLGVVSSSPYPGTFGIDLTARFGFSGGPVVLVRPDGTLELAGIIRSVPVTKVRYLAPPPDALPGQTLSPPDLSRVWVEELDLIEYGTAYAVGAEKIGQFLKESAPLLARKGISFPPSLLQ